MPRSQSVPPGAKQRASQARTASETDKKRHLSELLDEGLLETFPASDPVSVANIR